MSGSELSPCASGPLNASQCVRTSILAYELESILNRRWPHDSGESWDRSGLLVGDPQATITKVALGLDATVTAIRQAHAAGAQLLLTHHPVFLSGPNAFAPADSDALCAGAGVYEAINLGVGLMCYHTPLDVSLEAQQVLPSLLSLNFKRVLEPTVRYSHLGYGQMCSSNETLSLEQLASRCLSVFGRHPRVWGSPQKPLNKIVTTTGSAANMAQSCLEAGVDCLVCGEIKYHAALSAAEAGLSIVELGHDVSELPLVSVLAQSLLSLGLPSSSLVILDQNHNWFVPQARCV